jgi:hypothetical protein
MPAIMLHETSATIELALPNHPTGITRACRHLKSPSDNEFSKAHLFGSVVRDHRQLASKDLIRGKVDCLLHAPPRWHGVLLNTAELELCLEVHFVNACQ